MRYIIYPYKMFSTSSKILRNELPATRVYPDRRYRPKEDDIIINWGNSTLPNWYGTSPAVMRMLNDPNAVSLASNKLKTLRILEEAGISIPRFTTNINEAYDFGDVIVRHKLTGHSGRGIEIYRGGELPQAPLYTKYIEQKAEYRVHVFKGKVIDYIKKRRKDYDYPTENESMVRSYKNGWIFARNRLRRLERIESLAIDAVEALGLDFGAVDIVRGRDNSVYVLEVNTAPGLSGQTLESYLQAIREL